MLSEKIVLITSNLNEARNIQNMLAQLGYNVFTITSLQSDVITEIEKNIPDLMLIDITSEGDLCSMKTREEICDKFDLPTVFLVASSGDFALKREAESGAYDCLAKPFKERDLHASIQIALYKKMMANKLSESEQWYSTILKSIDEAVIITNIERQITFINPGGEALTGWKAEDVYKKDLVEVMELINENTESFTNFSPIKSLWDRITKGLSTGNTHILRLKAKDGTETIIENRGSLIRNNHNEMAGVVFIFRDITEKKQMEHLKEQMYKQQLIQADKLISLGTLVSGVAHEINNPNNFIMLNTPMLEEAWNDVAPILDKYYEKNGDFNLGGLKFTEMRKYIPQLFSGIFEGANRIKRIVSDLKDFARQDPSTMDQPVDINFVLKAAITLISHQVKKATHNLSVNYGKDIPQIKGNSQRLEQVIINLVLNACQSLQNPKKALFVKTSFTNSNNSVLLEIRDEGIGIPSNVISRILDPFFTTKRDIGGTGLGLSVSSGIIKDHGGDISFSSEEGKGTTVTIKLPVLKNA